MNNLLIKTNGKTDPSPFPRDIVFFSSLLERVMGWSFLVLFHENNSSSLLIEQQFFSLLEPAKH